MTLTFLLAYLFFNDGIQTVIASASIYGVEELEFGTGTVLATIPASSSSSRSSGRSASVGGRAVRRQVGDPGRPGDLDGDRHRWPCSSRRGDRRRSCCLAVAIGIVLGGTQALSRSYFSLLIPRGREAEYFSLYHAMERGTSWFGTLRLRPRSTS